MPLLTLLPLLIVLILGISVSIDRLKRRSHRTKYIIKLLENDSDMIQWNKKNWDKNPRIKSIRAKGKV